MTEANDDEQPESKPKEKIAKIVKKSKKPRKTADVIDETIGFVEALDDEVTEINLLVEANVLFETLGNYKMVDKTHPDIHEPQDVMEADIPKLIAVSDEVSDDIIMTNDNKPKKRRTKKKVLQRRGSVPEEIEIITVELEGEEPVTTVTVSELENMPLTNDSLGSVEKKKKKKKSVKKLKEDQEAEYIRGLIEAEIPKTILEKFNKSELPSKPKNLLDLLPMIVERKEQKAIKPVVCDVHDNPLLIKLKKVKPKPKPIEEEVAVPAFRLKSRITYLNYPPEMLFPKIKKMKTIRGRGELSRNIEEAEKVLKRKKLKKFKPTEFDKDDLESAESDVSLTQDEVGDEKIPSKEKYERKSKPAEPDETHKAPLKLGKGKHKPQIDESPEQIKLKPIPKKVPQDEEEADIPIKIGEATVQEPKLENVDTSYKLKPLEPFDSEPLNIEMEEYEKPDESDEIPEESEVPKPKYVRKKKKKVEPETVKHEIKKGVPRPKDESPEKDLTLHYKQKPAPEISTEDITLKPFDKPVGEMSPESMQKPTPTKPKSSKKKKRPDDTAPGFAVFDDDTGVINISDLPEHNEHSDTPHKTHTPHFEQITQINDSGKLNTFKMELISKDRFHRTGLRKLIFLFSSPF